MPSIVLSGPFDRIHEAQKIRTALRELGFITSIRYTDNYQWIVQACKSGEKKDD